MMNAANTPCATKEMCLAFQSDELLVDQPWLESVKPVDQGAAPLVVDRWIAPEPVDVEDALCPRLPV
jgi:hypothetical protein